MGTTTKAKTNQKRAATAKNKAKVAKAKVDKKVAKVAKKAALVESKKITAVPGQEGHFYKGFPRGLAYAVLTKARNRTMKVSTFLDKIEKLKGVKSRKQARGIVSKMLDKPGKDGRHNGQIAHYAK